MEFNFTVRGDKITEDEDYSFVEGNKGSYIAVFDFSEGIWEECTKLCVIECGDKIYKEPIFGGSCILPEFGSGTVRIGVIGVDSLDGGALSTRISTNMRTIGVQDGAASREANAQLNTAAEVWEKYLVNMEKNRQAAEAAAQAASESARLANNAQEAAKNAGEDAKASAENAAVSENNAKKSEVNSSASEKTASQALADLLAMINGGDIILATDGKLPLSAIPATATQEIYTVTSEDELTSLTAQRGDLAELIEEIDGEQAITKTWQCLGDASIRENWVVWGTSYAVQAGNATTANNTLNANMINNHRIVEMTEEEFEAAVKDEDTYYLVY